MAPLLLCVRAEAPMMRIDQRTEGDAVVLALEGDVAGPWADELARLLAALGADVAEIELDLANVAYVDREGEQILRDALSHGARLRARSGFVAALLEGCSGAEEAS